MVCVFKIIYFLRNTLTKAFIFISFSFRIDACADESIFSSKTLQEKQKKQVNEKEFDKKRLFFFILTQFWVLNSKTLQSVEGQ